MIYKNIFPVFSDENKTEFNLWAPKAKNIKLVLEKQEVEIELEKQEKGYWYISAENIEARDLYRYKIDNGETFPDPASLSQPHGVNGASQIIRLDDFEWTDGSWQNIPLKDMIQYELHTGTFSESGDFDGIASKLDYLQELGVNTIEILPVAQFSGERNWGYDGVYPFAVQNSYGGAKSLMNLVNSCHEKGIAVIMDVVYNHFGPEGNYATRFGNYFSEKYSTPWGKPINFDGPHSDGVRNFVVQNILMWCRDFHIDGLRLDAVHAIYDFSARHIMQELAENLEDLSSEMNREFYLIAESNLNDVRYINPTGKGGYGLDAQWSDDFHHSVHTLVTGENRGYYMDYGKPGDLSKSLEDAFVYDGRYSEFRKKSYGSKTRHNPGHQFVIFTQNHDQTGNRKFGERLISLTDFETAKLAAGTMFVSPNIPMLFMGEEYGEKNPLLYFVSHLDSYLNEMVRKGRNEEFKDFHEDNKEAPDPVSTETFLKSKLSWNIQNDKHKSAMFEFYKKIIRLRKEHPVLMKPDKENISVSESKKVYTLKRLHKNDEILGFLNFNEQDISVKIPETENDKLEKLIDSSAERFGGPGEIAPVLVQQEDDIKILSKSIIIYSNYAL
ncbi:MAG: malto-oligosyltrehalose trehalohydrolase [Bacteroidota bacterium]